MFRGLDLDGKKKSREENQALRKRGSRSEKLAKKRELLANRQAKRLWQEQNAAAAMQAAMQAATADVDDDTLCPYQPPPPLPDDSHDGYELVAPVQQLEDQLEANMATTFSQIHDAFNRGKKPVIETVE